MTALATHALTRRFGSLTALDSVDLEVPEASFTVLLGPSGCGKTTLLRLVAGIDRPTSGRIEIAGRDVTRLPSHRRPVNTVFQSYALFPHLDVRENIAFALREARWKRGAIDQRVRELLELIRLEQRATARPSQLSGGQQQRVALARALAARPTVLLLDEPLAALDLLLRRELAGELRAMQLASETSFVHVTHDQEEAFAIADRVACMRDGRIEQLAEPEELYRRPVSRFVAGFVGRASLLRTTVERALADGRYETGLGIETMGAPGLRVGDPAVLVARPEHVSLAADGELGGEVVSTSFVGGRNEIRVEVEGIGSVLATGRAARRDHVRLAINPERCWLLRYEQEEENR